MKRSASPHVQPLEIMVSAARTRFEKNVEALRRPVRERKRPPCAAGGRPVAAEAHVPRFHEE